MLKIRLIDIAVRNKHIALLNKRDAQKHELSAGEKVLVQNGHHQVICELDILDKNAWVPDGEVELAEGEIGLFEEAFRELRRPEGSLIHLSPLPKAPSYQNVLRKLAGGALKPTHYQAILQDIVAGQYADTEIAAFLLALDQHPLAENEIVALTRAMVRTGDQLHFSSSLVADKHCIGGLPGNRTTPLVVAIVGSLGLTIPCSFTRSITSPAGTADTLETYLNVQLDPAQIRRVVTKAGAALAWVGGLNLVPIDDIFASVERKIGINSRSKRIASILSKKVAMGITHLLIDIPYGPAAKLKTRVAAQQEKEAYERIGKKLGLKMRVVLTDGRWPVGRGIGPILEMRDILAVLYHRAEAPLDLIHKSVDLAAELLCLTGYFRQRAQASRAALDALQSGQAAEFFERLRTIQGGVDLPPLTKPLIVTASRRGVVKEIDLQVLNEICHRAGAPFDHGAGVYLFKTVGEAVAVGDALCAIYSSSPLRRRQALSKADQLYSLSKNQ